MEFAQRDKDKHNVAVTHKAIPEVGKTYYAYDDGKIRHSKESKFRITKAIDLDHDDISAETTCDGRPLLEVLKSGIEYCYWLYAKEQHMIYYGEDTDIPAASQWFIRTIDGRWFGIGTDWCDALLDVTGEYHDMVMKDNNWI